MRRWGVWAALLVGGLPAMGQAVRAAELEPALRDRVEESLATNFIRPDTAIWRYDAVKKLSGGQRVVCGAVNFESAAHRYLGFQRFYALVDDDRVTLAQISDPTQDPSGRLEEKLTLLCGEP